MAAFRDSLARPPANRDGRNNTNVVCLRLSVYFDGVKLDALARLEVAFKLARGFDELIANEEIRKIGGIWAYKAPAGLTVVF